MAVLDLSAYKPVPGTLEDANQIANGFQAVQNCINALDNNNFAAGKIFDPLKLMQDGATAGQGLVWSAAANGGTGGWVPGNAGGLGGAVTVSTMAGGPPGSPADKDVWIATAVDANGTRWVFQYNAGSASAFKWEFIGGSRLHNGPTGAGATPAGTGAFMSLGANGPTLTLPRAGDYEVTMGLGGVWAGGAVNAGNYAFGFSINGAAPVGGIGGLFTADIEDAAGVQQYVTSTAFTRVLAGRAAADVITLQALVTNTNTLHITNGLELYVQPVRIS